MENNKGDYLVINSSRFTMFLSNIEDNIYNLKGDVHKICIIILYLYCVQRSNFKSLFEIKSCE